MAPDPKPHSGSFGNSFPTYQLKLSEDLTSIENFEIIQGPILYSSKILEIIINEGNIIELISSQTFYCYADNEWKRVITKAKFKKIN